MLPRRTAEPDRDLDLPGTERAEMNRFEDVLVGTDILKQQRSLRSEDGQMVGGQ